MAPCCGGTRVEHGDELLERSGQPKGMYRPMHMNEWPSAYSAHGPALRLMNLRMEEVGVLSVAILRLCVSQAKTALTSVPPNRTTSLLARQSLTAAASSAAAITGLSTV